MDRMKVLVVDDEAEFLELIGMRINGWGYDAVLAANNKDAIGLAGSARPDILVIDYVMPDSNGVELLREIRKVNKTAPAIILTAHPDVKSIKSAERLNVSFYIPKLSTYSDSQTNLKSALNMLAKKLDKKEGKGSANG